MIVLSNSNYLTLRILRLTYIENLVEYEKEFILKNKKEPFLYEGPLFNTLEQNLQLKFNDFFEGLGINNGLAYLIEELSIKKNNFLIRNWIETFKKHSY